MRLAGIPGEMVNRTPIAHYMTRSPHSIGVDQPLSKALELMRAHKIRHLPALRGGRLVGLLSLRDIRLVETLGDFDAERITVEEAMTPEVYQVAPATPMGVVASEMASRKLGSAVVVDEGRVIGVFTTVDALRALAQTANG